MLFAFVVVVFCVNFCLIRIVLWFCTLGERFWVPCCCVSVLIGPFCVSAWVLPLFAAFSFWVATVFIYIFWKYFRFSFYCVLLYAWCDLGIMSCLGCDLFYSSGILFSIFCGFICMSGNRWWEAEILWLFKDIALFLTLVLCENALISFWDIVWSASTDFKRALHCSSVHLTRLWLIKIYQNLITRCS